MALILPSLSNCISGSGCTERVDEAAEHHGSEVSTKMPTPFMRVPIRPPDFFGGGEKCHRQNRPWSFPSAGTCRTEELSKFYARDFMILFLV
jgi:hypothetical protein